jgi:hypothetical protein
VERHQLNLAWLSERPLIGTVPGGFRLDYFPLGVETVLLSEEQKAAAMTTDEILLPKACRGEEPAGDDEALMAKWRRKANDVQHLIAHLIASDDAFVTSDDDDMLKKRRPPSANRAAGPRKPPSSCGMSRQPSPPPRGRISTFPKRMALD